MAEVHCPFSESLVVFCMLHVVNFSKQILYQKVPLFHDEPDTLAHCVTKNGACGVSSASNVSEICEEASLP